MYCPKCGTENPDDAQLCRSCSWALTSTAARNRIKKQARSVACMSKLKQWGLIFAMYTEDNNGYFFSGQGDESGRSWMDPLRPYYRDSTLLLCPEATKPYTMGGQNPFGAWEVDNEVGSYGLNGWICNPPQEKTELWGHGPTENYWRTPKVKGANNIPVLLDAMWANAWPKSADQPPEWENWREDKCNINGMRCFCVNRHEGYVNVLFMDWSARKVGLKELWTLKWHRNYNTNGQWTRAGGVRPSDWPPWMRNLKNY